MGKLTMGTTLKGIIFDMDGTLLDTLDDVVHSMNKILERHGSPHLGREFYRAGRYETALEFFDDAAKDEPRNPEAAYHRLQCLDKLKKGGFSRRPLKNEQSKPL